MGVVVGHLQTAGEGVGVLTGQWGVEAVPGGAAEGRRVQPPGLAWMREGHQGLGAGGLSDPGQKGELGVVGGLSGWVGLGAGRDLWREKNGN